MREVETPHGPARLHVHAPPGPPAGRVVVLHGAGTDSGAPLLVHLAGAVAAAGWQAVRLDMPHRVAGRKAPPPAAQLDAALVAAVAALEPMPLVLLGRSTGARVACRTATLVGARQVVALGYPLVPPPARVANGGLGADDPRTAGRRAELLGAGVPVLVVQGSRDPFGGPELFAGVAVHEVAGADHALSVRRSDGRAAADVLAEVTAVVTAGVLGALRPRRPR